MGNSEYRSVNGASNNLSFNHCRWEANHFVGLRLIDGSRKIHIVDSKFHGELPVAAPYDHVQMYSSNSNIIMGSNFTHGGKTAILMRQGYGNVISNNTIGGQPAYPIDVEGSARDIFVGNTLNVENSDSGLGDIRWQRNLESQFHGNVGRRSCVLNLNTVTCESPGPTSQSLVDSLN